MFLETFHDPGLGHLSYMIGDAGTSAVIDPRRDVDVYLQAARRHGVRIDHILETHRNEDYVVGSRELQVKTGATIFHGPHTEFGYGAHIDEGQVFELGNVRIETLETPGHTDESLSFVVIDRETSDEAIGVFTGDTLFVGDVGRTDLFPDRAEEMAEKLHDSLFAKLLALGDDVMVWPAHGAGSVCGENMASRTFSTIGHEMRHNPALQTSDKDGFVQRQLKKRLDTPPYFERMEQINAAGPSVLGGLPFLQPVHVERVAQYLQQGEHVVLDVRQPESVCGAFIDGAVTIPFDMLAAYAGWFLPYRKNLLVVTEPHQDVEQVARVLIRLGFERLDGYLAGGMRAWEMSGRPYGRFRAMHVEEVAELLKAGDQDWNLLDVRTPEEYQTERLAGAEHVPIKGMMQRLDGLDRDQAYTTFCGSGRRAVIAASVLRRAWFQNVDVCLGSMAACKALGLETTGERAEGVSLAAAEE